MALTDEVTARYSAQRLVEVTNPDAAAAVVVDAGRLAKACADAAGDFRTFVGVALDLADASHLGPAVRRAYATLLWYMDPAGATSKQEMADTQSELERLRDRIGAGTRHPIATDSRLSPSYVDTSAGTVRPVFDTGRMNDILPGSNPIDPNS